MAKKDFNIDTKKSFFNTVKYLFLELRKSLGPELVVTPLA
jgi:hypothetical protein